ncbi:MAG TPA: TadG family pilus assembly protein [Terracidiphilus sp.]|nr:TadG family pilus assembly protein [Terracidiphilus sp.]
MKFIDKIPVLGRLIKEDKGQALIFTAMTLFSILGVAGIAVDAGKGYYAFEMLRASTNAAALAGAAGMPNTTTATTYADNYGSQVSAYNSNGVLSGVQTNVSFKCLSSVTTDFYAGCENSSGTDTGTVYNAIQVQQTASVPTWVGPIFGVPTFSIQDTATASMKGGTPTPYNIAIILDTTESMTGKDDGKNNTSSCTTQIGCAELGIQTFLTFLVPGTSTSPVDEVTLYVFPGASTSTISNDYACNSSKPSITPYTFTSATSLPSTSSQPSNYALPSGYTYNVLYNTTTSASGWSNDYKTSSGSTLSNSSNLVKAVGGVSGCGATAPGGEGTYYAQVIYQAGVDLAAEHAKNGNANMLIILSDGDATACNTQTTTGNDCTNGNSNQIQVSTCPTITTANGTITSAAPCASPYTGQPINGTDYSYSSGSGTHRTTTNIQPTGYESYTYPSALGLCGQAVVASQWVASLADTVVYTIGYGTEKSGCTTDSTYSSTVSTSYGSNSWGPGGTPCQAMGAMATGSAYFFSDDANGCAAPNSNNSGITSLQGIFNKIGENLTSSRLIPNSAT